MPRVEMVNPDWTTVEFIPCRVLWWEYRVKRDQVEIGEISLSEGRYD